MGYGVLRVTRDQRWRPYYLGNIVYNTLLALLFQWGVAVQHPSWAASARPEAKAELRRDLAEVGAKAGRQVAKDYVVYPALVAATTGTKVGRRRAFAKGRHGECDGQCHPQCVDQRGHLLRALPDGAEKFTKQDVDSETQGEWYLRQMLGSANFRCGPVLAFMSGNLSYQIEHHIFPDLPSNRLAEISVRVQASATSTTCPTPPARSCCSTSSRGAPSPSCRFRTST